MSSNLTCQIVQIWVAIAIWKLGLLCFCETAWKKKSQSDIATSLSRYQTHKMSKKSNWPGRFHGRCCDLFYFTFMSHRTGGDWHRCGNKMSEHQMWLNFICVCWKCHQLSDWWRGGGIFSVHLADGWLCSSLLFFDGALSLCFYCLCRPEGQQVLLHRSYWDLVSTK